MLSPLQERVAALVAGIEDASEFALAGGAALIVQGRISRQTRDLDFFGPAPADVDRLLPRVEASLAEEGLTVRRVMVNPGFARLEIGDGRDRTELDLAADARLLPVQPTTPAPTLSGLELGADKVLAIFSRAEARDFSDLVPLEEAYGLDQLLDLAGQKDLGFQPQYFAEMLERFDRFRRAEFDISDEEFAHLKGSVGRWRERAMERSQQRGRDRGHGLDLGC